MNRVKLRDGRFLAYKERGVPKNEAKYKIILIHGFGSSKEMNFSASKVYYFGPFCGFLGFFCKVFFILSQLDFVGVDRRARRIFSTLRPSWIWRF